jgi:hypothetical protein
MKPLYFYFNADPDPACHFNVDPDPAEFFLERKKKCENFTIGEVAKPRS